MAVRTNYFVTSCKGKKKYKTPKIAQSVVERMNAENRRLGNIERVEYYPCDFCHNFHVGHELHQEKKIRNDGPNKSRGK